MDVRWVPGSPEDRRALSRLRAEEWRHELSVDGYLKRNERLYAHSFGRSRMETHTLRNGSGKIVTSCDFLRLRLLAAGRVRDGILLASVLTPPEERGKGYSSHLLSSLFSARPELPGVLSSDIAPSFYERYGFTARPMTAITLPARLGSVAGEPLRASEFLEALSTLREKNLAASGRIAAAVLIDEELLDWHLERFRLFAELAGGRLPETLFWKLTHLGTEHLVASVPDLVSRRLELLWKYPGCKECEANGQALAESWGLETVRFWDADPVRLGKRECPMIRVPELGERVFFSDPQLIDSW